MLLPSDQPAFAITHPLGLPRPLDPENFFGAKKTFFACNQMPIPSGCLAHFDLTVYRPYARSVLAFLAQAQPGWSGLALVDEPPRYCLLRFETPAQVGEELRPFLPDPPLVTLKTVLRHLGRRPADHPPMELLDVLTLVSEDLGSARFAAVATAHPWVREFMR